MQLHRTSGVPDWETVPAADRNHWQRTAAATRGIATPGNAFSLAGLILVIAGLILLANQQYLAGAIAVGIGRLADLADGQAADKTGTKSPLGEFVDASLDKVEAILALIIFAVVGLAPLWIMAIIALQNVANVVFGYTARRRGVELHPSAAGKIATAGQWLIFLLFVVAAANDGVWNTVAYGAAGITIGLGFYATAGYGRGAMQPKA